MTPFCPKCGKKLDHLIYCEKSSYPAELINGEIYVTLTEEVVETWYECPFCRKKLFSDDDSAVKFLKEAEEE